MSEACISSINGLKAATEEVYTEELCAIIYKTKLTSVYDNDGNIVSYARYWEKTDENKQKILMVYKAADARYENEVEYLYDTLKVVGSEGEYIKITVDVKLTTFAGLSRVESAEFILLEEANGFRLDTLSFVKY